MILWDKRAWEFYGGLAPWSKLDRLCMWRCICPKKLFPKAKKGKRLFRPPKHFHSWCGVFPHQIAQFLAPFGQQPPYSVINQRTNLGNNSDNGHKGTTGFLQPQHRRLELCKHLNLENSPFCRVKKYKFL